MVVPASFVADTSFTMPWIFQDEERSAVCDASWEALKTTSVSIHVPALWLLEVMNALRNRENAGKISGEEIDKFLDVLRQAPITVAHLGMDEILATIPQYMRKHGLTSYDATFLLLAIRKNLPLATFDKKLQNAARVEGITLVE